MVNPQRVRKTVTVMLFLLYLGYLLYLVFFSKYYGRNCIYHSYNFIPFYTMSEYLSAGSFRAILVNIAGNILAFMPMGFMLPLISSRFKRIGRITGALLFATCFIEMIQYCTGVGVCDVDDIILNVLGGLLGYFIYITGTVLLIYMKKYAEDKNNIWEIPDNK